MYNVNSHIIKTTMLKSNLRNYSDAYILVKESLTVVGQGTIEALRAYDRNNN